jgi:hypothetical protein
VTAFYRLDVRNVSLREFARAGWDPLSIGITLLITKLFRIPLPAHVDCARLESLERVGAWEAPGRLRERCDEVRDECAAWNLQPQFYYRRPAGVGKTGHAAALVTGDRAVLSVVELIDYGAQDTAFTCFSR